MTPPPVAKRGNPSLLSPAALELLERLWTTTHKTHATIAREVGCDVDYVRNAAKARGWVRFSRTEHATTREDRIRTKALLAEPKREPERVRLVPSGTFARGAPFSMMGGRV